MCIRDRHRIDRGDAEQEADNRIGRRSASLAEDRWLLAARETDEIVDGEEIIDIIPPPDQAQFVADQLADFRWQGRAIARLGGCLHQMVQIVEGLPSRRHRLVRIFVAQFVEREADTAEQSHALLDRFRTCLLYTSRCV